ncbi:tRNA-modifying protein YgfZ [Gammaproteobacteria bacterium]|nr:tRNA-modifying protein YgfZ [Gammaproteobacteria bacterium]MDC3411549.1 tRNA-modifying protein YgfZ [Gammaproteobacteria bacterium]
MADFLLSKSSNKYKIIINRELVDTLIDELTPFAKFFSVTFLEKTNYVRASVESEPFGKSIFLKSNTFALSVEIEDDKKDITNTISLKEWSAANMMLGNFYLSKNEIGKYRPLEINYDIQRVSFDKGCFRGQEIIARMKYLGINRRRFCTIISKSEIKEEKHLKIIGESIKLKDSFIYLSLIKKDFLGVLKEDTSLLII